MTPPPEPESKVHQDSKTGAFSCKDCGQKAGRDMNGWFREHKCPPVSKGPLKETEPMQRPEKPLSEWKTICRM